MREFVLRRASVFVMVVAMVAGVRSGQAQDTSTPEEHAGWAEATHKLEASPLVQTVNSAGETALKQVMDAKDFHVPLCSTLFGAFNGMKYQYQHAMVRQLMLGSATYMVENPDKASDLPAMNLYAVESALKAYAAILQQQPGAKSKDMEMLAKKQEKGDLQKYINDKCH